MNKIKKVLVVDDSKLARLTLSRLLTNKGIDVIEADSVSNALGILENEIVDTIFLDVQMPVQTGFDALKILKESDKLKHIPCSMYSGDLSTQAQKEAIMCGAQAYLFKPANTESLDHVLEALANNIIAEDMLSFVAPSQEEEEKTQNTPQKVQAIKKHRKALATLDDRTRHLARLLSNKNQELHNVSDQVTALNIEIETLKKHNQFMQHDELLQKRTDNDIRGQLQKTKDNLRLATTISFVATVVAVFALILTVIVYFNYLRH